MFDPKLYRNACSELHASEEKMEEILAMTTNSVEKKKTRHPLRIAAVTAATVALLTVGASAAANPEAAQELIYHITSVIQVGQFRQDMTTDTGEKISSYAVPDISVVDRDGRAILLVEGQETDITDALAQEGKYVCKFGDEGTQFTATVEGTAQDWTLTVDMETAGENSVLYSFVTDSTEGAGSITAGEGQLSADTAEGSETSVTLSAWVGSDSEED